MEVNTVKKETTGKSKGASKPLESAIQREICDYLASRGYFFWRSNNIPVFGVNNAGQRRFRSLPKYTPKGIPDILLLSSGKFIGIEVKREGMKLRPGQAEFGAKMVMNGGAYHIVHSLAEVKEVL